MPDAAIPSRCDEAGRPSRVGPYRACARDRRLTDHLLDPLVKSIASLGWKADGVNQVAPARTSTS